MLPGEPQPLYMVFLILTAALLIDLLAGDPPNRFHPTAWMGGFSSKLAVRLRSERRAVELWGGVLLATVTVAVFSAGAYIILWSASSAFGVIGFVVVAAVVLKLTFSVKNMHDRALNVFRLLTLANVGEARSALSLIVRRETAGLPPSKVVSATVETIAESTVDGVTAALFYYSLFGPVGAVASRAVNTLDSTVGYKAPPYTHLGRASALLDTAVNYIPARLTGLLMVAAARLTGFDSKGAWRMLIRDRNKTESRNAGWTMAAMAGALGVELEKLGHYRLGDSRTELQPAHILAALRVMQVTVALFIGGVVVPLMFAVSLA